MRINVAFVCVRSDWDLIAGPRASPAVLLAETRTHAMVTPPPPTSANV